jgi:hypothetical protein
MTLSRETLCFCVLCRRDPVSSVLLSNHRSIPARPCNYRSLDIDDFLTDRTGYRVQVAGRGEHQGGKLWLTRCRQAER